MIAEKWDVSREEMEQYALESHRRAVAAIAEGRFDREIVPVRRHAAPTRARAPDTSLEKMAALKTLREGGRVTAAVSSQISDAASAVLVASEDARTPLRADAARPRPPHLRPRRRPGVHAHRADPGHPLRAGQGRT